MTLRAILIFLALAVIFRLAGRGKARGWLLLVSSALAIYWLQPAVPIRNLDYWLPTATLGLTALMWALTSPPEERRAPQNIITAAVLAGLVLLVAASRFISTKGILTPTRPPQFWQALIGVAALALIAWLAVRFSKPARGLLWAAFAFILVLFILLKTPPLAQTAAGWLRSLMGQSPALASAADLRWLGFSYVAFRIIHTLRDRQAGRLPAVTLQEYVIFVIFFPAFTAGPIDRIERFIKDLRAPLDLSAQDFGEAGKRLALGLLKKFVLADALAIMALGAANAGQVRTTGWAWVLLYAYAFQILFDFSGYTDIAIGLGRLLGISLPENFNHPYLKPNLTQFWNNWHMSLTQWFRTYFFNPVTRALRRGSKPLAPALVILLTQLGTMLLIGLWHGVTWNFVLWGAWHGMGLFVQNRYSEWMKPRLGFLEGRPWLRRTFTVLGVLLTFHYVALGWVWFALPTPASALHFLGLLAGR